MFCDPSVDHLFDLFMLDELASLDGCPAFFDKFQKAGLLFGHVADRARRKPGSAAALRTRYAIDEGQSFRIETGGDDGAAHESNVSLVYNRFKLLVIRRESF